MNLVYGSFCPLHEGNKQCPCRSLTTNASIWTAAELGDLERVRTLIRARGRSPNALDPHGYTPLHLAAQQGRAPVVHFLLQAGATPDGAPQAEGGCGATPLHRAAYSGKLQCVEALLSAGADPSAEDASFVDMKTPLHKAISQGHRDVAMALLKAGANPNALDSAGNSPMDTLMLARKKPPCAGSNLRKNDSQKAEGIDVGDILGLGEAEADSNRTHDDSLGHLNDVGGCNTQDAADPEKDWKGIITSLEQYGARGQRSRGGERPCANHGHEDSCNQSVSHRSFAEGVSGTGDGKRSIAVGGMGEPEALRSLVVIAVSPGASPETNRDMHEEDSAVDSKTVDTHRVENKNGDGFPCGECGLPTVVMVRAPCCKVLLCKPCVRNVNVRRSKCRRCCGERESGDM